MTTLINYPGPKEQYIYMGRFGFRTGCLRRKLEHNWSDIKDVLVKFHHTILSTKHREGVYGPVSGQLKTELAAQGFVDVTRSNSLASISKPRSIYRAQPSKYLFFSTTLFLLELV